jgi:hypothetical protein
MTLVVAFLLVLPLPPFSFILVSPLRVLEAFCVRP